MVREFRSFTVGLRALRDWLAGHGVTQVAMEATGVYWKPVWHVLEADPRWQLLLANAQHVKNLPGRKSDVADAAWLAQLLECGLLRGSFIPPRAIQQLRDLTRYRKKLVEERTSETPLAESCHSLLRRRRRSGPGRRRSPGLQDDRDGDSCLLGTPVWTNAAPTIRAAIPVAGVAPAR